MTVLTYGRYELREVLGTGGLGQVYGGMDLRLKRPVAVKVLRPELANDSALLERFNDEATSLAKLHHPNITTLFALEDDPRLFMVMELVRGCTLESILRTRRLTALECLAVASQTLAGLAYAHERGIIHRDIKPSNLMIEEGGTVKLMDFGIARARGSKRLTQVGFQIGTLLYMSPEQIRGEEGDERSDLYSLAIMLYEMLSGAGPFDVKSDYDLQRAHNEMPPPRLVGRVDNVPERVETALLKALEKKPDDRFATADEFRDALGCREIQGDIPLILRKLISEPAFTMSQPRAISANDPAATDFAAASAISNAGLAGTGKSARTPALARENRPNPLLLAVREHLPLTLLGASAAICLAVAGVVVFGSGTTPKPLQNTNPPYVQPAPTPAPTPTPAPSVANNPPPHVTAPVAPVTPAPTLPQRAAVSGAFDGALSSNAIDIQNYPDDIQVFGIQDPAAAYSNTALLGQITGAIGKIVAQAGGQLQCNPHDLTHYQCFLGNQDYAELVLSAGLSTVTADAPPAYVDAQNRAQAAHLGLWANQN